MKRYSLDQAHFHISSELAWQACLKKTCIELELLTGPDMLLMFERGIRTGITQAVHRYAKANSKYMDDTAGTCGAKFNPKGESSYLQYLDVNNLYGWAMNQLLQTGGFEWVDLSQFTPDKIDFYANCENDGYLLSIRG